MDKLTLHSIDPQTKKTTKLQVDFQRTVRYIINWVEWKLKGNRLIGSCAVTTKDTFKAIDEITIKTQETNIGLGSCIDIEIYLIADNNTFIGRVVNITTSDLTTLPEFCSNCRLIRKYLYNCLDCKQNPFAELVNASDDEDGIEPGDIFKILPTSKEEEDELRNKYRIP